MNIIVCITVFITISNRIRTNFSDSPLYFEVRVDELTLKNVVPHSVATALANIVFPVPGGPTINTPLQGLRIPLKKSGINMGNTTALKKNWDLRKLFSMKKVIISIRKFNDPRQALHTSSNNLLASFKSAMSSQCMLAENP